MKKLLSSFLLILVTSFGFSQITDTGNNIGIGKSVPTSKLHIYIGASESTYPTITERGDVIQYLESYNNAIEIGNARAMNARQAWILARHSAFNTYGKYFSTLHLQPDVGDKSAYKGVAIGYNANTSLPIGTHLAVNGNVGIGVISPLSKFQINMPSVPLVEPIKSTATIVGTNNFSGGHRIASIALIDEVDSYASGTGGGVLFGGKYTTGYSQLGAGIKGVRESSIAGVDDWGLAFYTSKDNLLLNEVVRFDKNGNVGIGTTTPDDKLEIESIETIGVRIKTTGSSRYSRISLGTDNQVNQGFLIAYGTNYETTVNSRPNLVALKSYNDLAFFTGNDSYPIERMSISEEGKVKIGNAPTTGDYKLAVDGIIRCGELKVEDVTTWSDFVFAPGYKLRTLAQVEYFIKQNQHLPDVPSETQVKKEGYDLTDMNALLLQKIEELTLYTIEQQKEIEKSKKLEARILKLEKENTELKNIQSELENIKAIINQLNK